MGVKRASATGLCLATAAAGAVLAPPVAATAMADVVTAATKPNIIMIIADDLGYDQISLNGGGIATPNIDRIADGGVRFTDGYVAAPVCSPSRAGLMSGTHPARYGADSNFLSRNRSERLPTPTIANRLRSQGYQTMAIGKWDLSGGLQEQENTNSPLPHRAGFDGFHGILDGMSNYCAGTGELDHYTGSGYNRGTNTKYLTHEFNSTAVQYVTNHRDDANPFFLYLSYNAPHTPLQTPETCQGQPMSDQDRYRRMVEIMDNGVGAVLDALGTAAGNTMVVFTSDNGAQFSGFDGPLRGGKYTLFEGGVRVPFAMRWPAGLTGEPAVYPQMVSTLDLLPTFAAAAGAPVSGYPGRDLVPYLNGTATGVPHDRLQWRYVDDRKTSAQGTVKVAIRSGNYKYVRQTSPAGATSEYLFDLALDRAESSNLATDPDYAAVRDRLVAELNGWNQHNRCNEGFLHPRPAAQPRANQPDGYLGYEGTWRVVDVNGNNQYRGIADAASGRAMLAGSHYADVNVSAKVRLADRGHAGLIVRGASATTSPYRLARGYVIRLVAPTDGAERILLNRVDGPSTIVRSFDRNVDAGVTYQLGVTVVGGTVTVSVNGNVQFSWTDSAPLPGGAIGLRVVGATAYFDGLVADRLP